MVSGSIEKGALLSVQGTLDEARHPETGSLQSSESEFHVRVNDMPTCLVFTVHTWGTMAWVMVCPN